MTFSRPKPPHRTRTITSRHPLPSTPSASTSTANPSDATPTQAHPNPLFKPSTLTSNSSIPDSPPTSTRDSTSTSQLDLSPSLGRSSLGRSALNSTTSTLRSAIPFPTSTFDAVQARSRSVSRSRAHDGDAMSDHESVSGRSNDGSTTLDTTWLETKSRNELEYLLAAADKAMKEGERKLEAAARFGKMLVEENNQLRTRHDSLLSSSPSRPSPSRPWRNSQLGGTPLGVKTPDDQDWDDQPDQGDDFIKRHPRRSSQGAPISFSTSSPTTPIQASSSTHMSRHRLSSSASIASLFAPTPRTMGTSENLPLAVQNLSQANYALTIQLTDLEAESDRAEKIGKRRLKKLEKEIDELKKELEWAEDRNFKLEEEKDRKSFLSEDNKIGAGEGMFSSLSRDSSSKSIASQALSEEEIVVPVASEIYAEDGQLLGQATPIVKRASSAINDLLQKTPASPSTPTKNHHRVPGVGFSQPRQKQQKFRFSPEKEEEGSLLVSQLVKKIQELQSTNEVIESEREEMNERLDRAQKELDLFKERCEELTSVVESVIDWQPKQGTIEWPSEGEEADDDEDDGSPQRSRHSRNLIGNQRQISRNRRLSFLSNRSSSMNPIPVKTSTRNFSRSLGSELGGNEDDDDYGGEGEDEDYSSENSFEGIGDPHQISYTSSVLTPIKKTASSLIATPPSRQRPSSSSTIIPDLTEYEQLSAAVSSLPVVWEDDRALLGVGKRSNSIASSPRVPSGNFLRDLKWSSEENRRLGRDEEEDDDEIFGTGSKFDQKRLKWGEIRKRRYETGGNGKGKGKEREEESDEGSRRDMALLRIGITSSSSSSTTTTTGANVNRRRSIVENSMDDSDSSSSSLSSDYDYLRTGEYHKKSADYYPVALRARYHPKIVLSRTLDSALGHAVLFITYLKFLVVLGFAMGFALWQGPKQTLGLVERRRRLPDR